MTDSSVFHPQSPFARATVDLLNVTLIVSAAIFALVAGLVLICLLRFRPKPNRPEPVQSHGHRKLEILWTVLPLLLLVYLFVLTARAMTASSPPTQSQKPDLLVIGHQFWWEIHYPATGVVTANEIHIPVGRKILIELGTVDVIHDFWVPQLCRKIDLVPDARRYLWLQADQPGVYQGACSEFCGVQHAWMRLLVVADPPEQFEQWQKHQLEPAPVPTSGEAERGARLAVQLTCVNCHSLGPQTAKLEAGPDLNHVASRRTLGAGVLDNTPENLARWLRNPQAVKPGNLMPDMRLNPEQVSEITSFLLTRK